MHEQPRKRMHRRERRAGVRFVTASCNHRLPLFQSAPLRDVFVDALRKTRATHEFELYAWVVMPEHFHLLVRPVSVPLATVLVTLKQTVSQLVIPRWKTLNAPILRKIEAPRGGFRFWLAGGGFDRNVRNTEELSREVRYIHRNPVERGLVSDPREWRWSSVHAWIDQRGADLPCDTPPGRLEWSRWSGFM